MISFRTLAQKNFAQNTFSCMMVSNPNRMPASPTLASVNGQSDMKLIPCTILIYVQYLFWLVHLAMILVWMSGLPLADVSVRLLTAMTLAVFNITKAH